MTTPQSSAGFPASVDWHRWADAGFVWSGRVPQARLTRLAAQALPPAKDWLVQCELIRRDRVLWLNGTLKGEVTLPCQRCLQPVTIVVETPVSLALLASEAEAERLEDGADFILLDEAVAIQEQPAGQLDLLALLEDELLLALPLSPRHEDCEPVAYNQSSGQEDEAKSDNPFAVLAGLKRDLS